MGYAVSVPEGYVYEGAGGAHLDKEISDWLQIHAPGACPVMSGDGFNIRFADKNIAENFLYSFI